MIRLPLLQRALGVFFLPFQFQETATAVSLGFAQFFLEQRFAAKIAVLVILAEQAITLWVGEGTIAANLLTVFDNLFGGIRSH